MRDIRKGLFSMNGWSKEEVLADIETLVHGILKEIEKINKKPNKEAEKRIRLMTKGIETLGTKYRTLSV